MLEVNTNKIFVLYTVLVGGYDKIIDPQVIDPAIDYICFVGKGESIHHHSDVWRFEEINEVIEDKGRLSRFPKILPHCTCLNKYDYSLYIDANILIKDQFVYDRIKKLASEGTKLALLKHPFRDCVYQEAYVCIAACKGAWMDIIRQILFLKCKRIPKHGGLYEANVIFRKHNDKEIVDMDECWWETFMNYSKRDQLSLVYALNLYKLPFDFFLPSGQTTRNHYAFEKILHNKQNSTKELTIKKRIVRLLSGLFRRLLKEKKKDDKQ